MARGWANRETSDFEGRRPRTAKEYVRDQLRRQILTGELAGGTRLVQADVAHELEVSTTPVREALHDLASEGFVRLDPHRGAVVSQFESQELREIFELRRVLEPMVIRLAIENIGGADFERLEALCQKMESTTSITEWVEANRHFHRVFQELSGWPRLASIVGSLQDSASPFVAMAMRFRPDMMQEGNHDHRILLDAARRRDVDEAVQCTMDHMDITMKALQERLPDVGAPEPL